MQNIYIYRLDENGGPAVARKFGIQHATGDFVIHCDSDDWIDLTMYEEMYNYAIQNGLDMVWCDINCTNDGKTFTYSYQECEPDKYALISGFLTAKLGATTPNRLCKRTLYDKDFIFPVGNMTEDFVIVSQLVLNSEKIGHLRVPYYKYWYNSSSITKRTDKAGVLKRFNDSVANFDLVLKALERRGLLEQFKEDIIVKKLGCKNLLIPVLRSFTDCKTWASTYSEVNLALFFNKKVGWKTKIRCFLILLRLYPILRKL